MCFLRHLVLAGACTDFGPPFRWWNFRGPIFRLPDPSRKRVRTTTIGTRRNALLSGWNGHRQRRREDQELEAGERRFGIGRGRRQLRIQNGETIRQRRPEARWRHNGPFVVSGHYSVAMVQTGTSKTLTLLLSVFVYRYWPSVNS